MILRKITLICLAAAALSAAAQYTPPMVAEEGTGEWCKFCVRGFVVSEVMYEAHPDNFILIAVHGNDEFAMEDYMASCNLPALPQANINRIYRQVDVKVEPFEYYYGEITKQVVSCKIELEAALDGNGNITAKTTSTFDGNSAQTYRVAIVLTEDLLPGIYQVNAYGDGSWGEMGGYENLPDRIPYPIFNHVAREIYPEYDGELLAEGVAASDVFEKDYTVPIPESVKEPRNLNVIALLLADERIIGAQSVPAFPQLKQAAVISNANGSMTKPKEMTATFDVTNPNTESATCSLARFTMTDRNGTKKELKAFNINLDPAQSTPMTVTSVTGKIADGIYTVNIQTSPDGKEWTDTDNTFTVTAGDAGVQAVEIQEAADNIRWFNLQGIEVANPQPGNIYIHRQGQKAEKVRL